MMDLFIRDVQKTLLGMFIRHCAWLSDLIDLKNVTAQIKLGLKTLEAKVGSKITNKEEALKSHYKQNMQEKETNQIWSSKRLINFLPHMAFASMTSKQRQVWPGHKPSQPVHVASQHLGTPLQRPGDLHNIV